MRRQRISNAAAAAIGAIVIAVACYFVFGGGLPWASSPFVLRAAFTANTELGVDSPVRVAGVDVGTVASVTPIPGSPTAAIVTMDLDRAALPVHAGATATIRARTFLEGNFYVALAPGSPGAPVLRSGATLPAASTSGPVQLDRVLSALDTPARADLQTILRGLGSALDAAPEGGTTGGQALNETLRYSVGALRASAIVNEALLGTSPHDLSTVVSGTGRVFAGLGADPGQLSGLIGSLDRTFDTLAARQSELGASIAQLPGVLRAANAAATNLQATYGPLARFSTALVPALRQLPQTTAQTVPWLDQLTALSSRPELGGLLDALTPAVDDTTAAVPATQRLIAQLELLARCGTQVLVPTGDETIRDAPQAGAEPVYLELLQSAVGLAGAAGNFDGNGRLVRASTAGGATLVQTRPVGTAGPLYGNAVLSPLGVRPALSGAAPVLTGAVACDREPAPNLNAVTTGTGP